MQPQEKNHSVPLHLMALQSSNLSYLKPPYLTSSP